jgi:hypothetical protein
MAETTIIGTMDAMPKALREETGATIRALIITIGITTIGTVGIIVRDKIRSNIMTAMAKIAATTVMIIMIIRESGFNNPKEPLLSPTAKKTDLISSPKEPILNPADKRTGRIGHPKEEMRDARGEITRNRKGIGNNRHNARQKAENRHQDVLGQTIEMTISHHENEFNLAPLAMTIGSHAPIENSSVLKNNRSEVQNSQVMPTSRGDAGDIKNG